MPATLTPCVPESAKEMRWRRTFPGKAEHARQFVRFLLDDTPARDDAVQVAAKLVANAASTRCRGCPVDC